MNLYRFSFRALTCAVLTLLAAMGTTGAACADDRNSATDIQVGFDGHSRLGAWFPVFVREDEGDLIDSYAIETVDADGFPVTLEGRPIRHADGWLECLMRAGRKHGVCQLHLKADGDTKRSWSFRLKDGSAKHIIHRSTQGLTLVIENGNSIAPTVATQSLITRSSESAIVSITQASQLPSNWLAWQAVERLIISASASEQQKPISPEQWLAIRKWVERGGNLVVSIGPDQGNALSDVGPWKTFSPGEYSGKGVIESSSRIEFFADANEQLIPRDGQPIDVCQFDAVQGRVELVQDSLPLVVSNAFGFGQLTFVAFDLNSERLTQWKGYSGLLLRILNPVDVGDTAGGRSSGNSKGSRVSHVGYTDLAGQLRLTLDRFSSVAFVSFASVASLIGLFILCVGPGDYFLLRKLAGRMELTWLTFPVISLLFCVGAFLMAKSVRPASIKLNQLEMIEIDQTSGQTRSNIWTHYYSPVGGQCSIELPTSTELADSIEDRVISWQGLPGDGLGGMNTRAVNSLTEQGYTQQVTDSGEQSGSDIHIVDQPLRVSSTRALFSQWWSATQFPVESKLKLNRRTQHIEGTFSNPLNQTLKDCRLLYGEYVYRLPDRLGPGDEIDIVGDDLREQTTSSYLNRRSKDTENVNGAYKTPWDPTSTGVDRLAEVLMFYSAAGGQEYTGLSHSYQPFVDLTDHLQLSRAILVGKVDSLVTPLQIDGQSSDDSYDSASTFVRLIFPVETR